MTTQKPNQDHKSLLTKLPTSSLWPVRETLITVPGERSFPKMLKNASKSPQTWQDLSVWKTCVMVSRPWKTKMLQALMTSSANRSITLDLLRFSGCLTCWIAWVPIHSRSYGGNQESLSCLNRAKIQPYLRAMPISLLCHTCTCNSLKDSYLL